MRWRPKLKSVTFDVVDTDGNYNAPVVMRPGDVLTLNATTNITWNGHDMSKHRKLTARLREIK